MKQALSQRQIEWIKKFDEGAKSLKCRNCRKFFTQTTYKKKKSLPICPHCGTHHQTKEDVGEASIYDFNDPNEKVAKYKKRRDYNDLKKDDVGNQFLKRVGKFEFYYSINEDGGYEGELVISVIDINEKVMVAKAPFWMRGEDFEASAPYVDPEYRNIGLGTQIYKTALDFGNVVSGNKKSQYAVGLWQKLYRELPNEMVAVDPKTKKEYPVTTDEAGKLKIETDDDVVLYGEGSKVYLKLYQNANTNN
jgi:GNAT superfamily N-acetyltransferase